MRAQWAFLRTWAEHGNTTGKSENIVDHLVKCKDVWENLDTSALNPPPPPKLHQNFNPYNNYVKVGSTGALGIAGSGVHGQHGAQNEGSRAPYVRQMSDYSMSGVYAAGRGGGAVQDAIGGGAWKAPEGAVQYGGDMNKKYLHYEG